MSTPENEDFAGSGDEASGGYPEEQPSADDNASTDRPERHEPSDGGDESTATGNPDAAGSTEE